MRRIGLASFLLQKSACFATKWSRVAIYHFASTYDIFYRIFSQFATVFYKFVYKCGRKKKGEDQSPLFFGRCSAFNAL